MLLDRKRIRKWARWVALFLAIIFAVGAVGIGVGSGIGNTNVFEALSCANEQTTDTTLTQDERINALLAALAQSPKDITIMQEIATAYLDNNDAANAANYLEQVIAVDPTQKDVYFRLAGLYMNTLSNYSAAVTVLNKAQALDPQNPDVYLQLGLAQRGLGNKSAAILAWQKYLSLAPNGDQAEAIRSAVAELSAQATTTTSTATTSTTAGSTSSTASSTTTSASTSTTASATTTVPQGPTTPAGR